MKKEDVEYFFRTYYYIVFRVALMEVKSKSDAEDIVQEVFLKLIASNIEFQGKEHEKAWIIRVTINLCKDFFKCKWNRDIVSLGSINIDENRCFSKLHTQNNDVLNTIVKLDEKYRRPIYLFYYEDYSIKEISEVLAIPENTVKTNLRRGRKKLSEIILKEMENSEK